MGVPLRDLGPHVEGVEEAGRHDYHGPSKPITDLEEKSHSPRGRVWRRRRLLDDGTTAGLRLH